MSRTGIWFGTQQKIGMAQQIRHTDFFVSHIRLPYPKALRQILLERLHSPTA